MTVNEMYKCEEANTCSLVNHWQNIVRLYKFDHLTGLKQRYDFEVETMHKMTKQKFWLVMADVNGLHSTNRNKGYSAGDSLVKQVAYDLQHYSGTWEVYRIGGDEFCALFFEKNEDIEIQNATCAGVCSADYDNFNDMFKAVDRLVIEKKNKLRRRRED